MHNIQETTASILQNLHVCSDLLRKVKLCQSLTNPTARNKSEIAQPPFSPLKQNQKLDNSPSDDRNNLNFGILEYNGPRILSVIVFMQFS